MNWVQNKGMKQTKSTPWHGSGAAFAAYAPRSRDTERMTAATTEKTRALEQAAGPEARAGWASAGSEERRSSVRTWSQ